MTWADAEAYCQSDGMHLASISDSAEDAVVYAVQESSPTQTFIGANGPRGRRAPGVWSSGDAWSYTNWSSGQPNNSGNEDCGTILSSGAWNDAPCTNTYPFVCETTN